MLFTLLFGIVFVTAAWFASRRFARRLKARLDRNDELAEIDRKDRLLFAARDRSRWVEKVPDNDAHVDKAFKKSDPPG